MTDCGSRVAIVALALLLFDAAGAASGDEFLVVDCALPGQIRQLGQKITYLSPRRPVKTSAADCRRRGGEYVVADLAEPRAAAAIWIEKAEAGDPEAMVAVGELLERGAQTAEDYREAADWYRRAGAQGSRRAMVNLGYLYEQGLGVDAAPDTGRSLYRQAAGLPEAATGDPGPRITIIEPVLAPVTRGLVRVEAPASRLPAEIVGRVSAARGLLTLHVDGSPVATNASGVFTAALAPDRGPGPLEIVAVDREGGRSAMTLMIGTDEASVQPASRTVQAGGGFASDVRYHALLIGNNDYGRLRDLRTPMADVDALARLLAARYGFETQVLTNATRYQILSALNRLRATLTPEDNLLIYYAGHGELDAANDRGHWLPVDAEPDSTANWLSNVAVTDIVNAMRARQVLIIADSCYSGTLTRSSIADLSAGMTDAEHATWLRLVAAKRARLVLTSGGVEPVMDSGGGRHSVFAKALLKTLEANADVLPGRALYQAVTARVAHTAAGYDFEQMPEFAPLSRAGHEAGDFLLVPVRSPGR